MSRRPLTNRHRRTLFDEAVAVLAAECGPGVTIDDVARRIGTSRRQLQRCFAEVAGTTFRAELTAARMRRAARLLLHPSLSVSEVATTVGFSDPSGFAKAFRRHHDLPPSAFRPARPMTPARAPLSYQAWRRGDGPEEM